MSELQAAKYQVVNRVGVIALDNTSVNSLGWSGSEGMIQAVEQDNAARRVAAFVRMGHGHSAIFGVAVCPDTFVCRDCSANEAEFKMAKS